ncbi:MAG: peptide chain release factor 3 [Deltaproteobacteria bacterium]|nr:peptide chain release factor 3 [Deltaproteobacteria bacterium]
MSERDEIAARVCRERRRRRTFAIISHPDAGKTTLTEKLLLYGGAIHLAGSVRARKASRHATSDWMKIEQQRGISVTSSVLQFEFEGHVINLLDTPGHQDFSEDTYRTLTAADAAVMLIDAAKGVEAQTRKLFTVCRMRGTPIFTFVNKLDRVSREPMDLMDEIESVLGIRTVPMTWPVGSGQLFRGIYDREAERLRVFEREGHGEQVIEERALSLAEAQGEGRLSHDERAHLEGEIALLSEAGEPFDLARVLAGQLSPMFFGSAMHNFGVAHFLSRFITLAPPPAPRQSSEGPIDPESPDLTAFVFKIQANMDPNHRDRVAFLRICSGEYRKDMLATHVRLGKKIKLSKPSTFMARERSEVETAYVGDIIGLFDPGHFRIGDVVTEGKPVQLEGIPQFAPEHFAIARLAEVVKRKQLQKGLDQLSQEGAIQVFRQRGLLDKDPIVGAVGQLQFDVLKFRMESEYGVELQLSPLSFDRARWLVGPPEELQRLERGDLATLVEDRDGHSMILIRDEFSENHLRSRHTKVQFLTTAPRAS